MTGYKCLEKLEEIDCVLAGGGTAQVSMCSVLYEIYDVIYIILLGFDENKYLLS